MKPRRAMGILVILLAALPAIQASLGLAARPPSPYEALKNMGILIPRDGLKEGVRIECHASIEGVRMTPGSGGYVGITARGRDPWRLEYLGVPGKPMIPYLVRLIIVEGYVDSASISVEPLSYSVLGLEDRITPAPKPLAYIPSGERFLEARPDPGVYGSDRYFPGRLASIRVFHGLLGRSIIAVKLYPVQYNPVRGRLVVVDRMRVEVVYGKARPLSFDGHGIVVITRRNLVGLLNDTLASFYREKGYRVAIVDVDQIYSEYPPAPNITYPGFYYPPWEDVVYKVLRDRYNYTLALKIISFLNDTLGDYSYVLLVGNALDVPPSFYFYESSIDAYNEWIPTDLFYSDLDRDLVPDIFVGRIPFSDPAKVSRVAEKIISWHGTPASRSGRLYLAGGHPFLLSLMFGETALSTMNLMGDTSSFYTVVMTRTSFNYSSEHVLSVLRGEEDATWLFMISHGGGSSFIDYTASPHGLGFEVLASSRDLANMTPNPSVPIVSSVACMDAAWDTDLVPPGFVTPSMGEAVLLSPAGGVAYIGSSRVAYEVIGPFVSNHGLLYNYYYGASLLHREIIASYNAHRLEGSEATLGEVVAEGIARYISIVADEAAEPSSEAVAISEAMNLALLGDPALELPVSRGEAGGAAILAVGVRGPATYVEAGDVFQGASGLMPFYRPGMTGIVKVLGKGSSNITVIEDRIGLAYGIYGRELSSITLINTSRIEFVDGYGVYRVVFGDERSGEVLVKFSVPGWGEARIIALSACFSVHPHIVQPGGTIRVEGLGMDLIGFYGRVAVLVGGRLADLARFDPRTGILNASLALPYMPPGNYSVTVMGNYYGDPGNAVGRLLEDYVVIRDTRSLEVRVVAPGIVELGDKVSIVVATMYRGEARDSSLSVNITSPSGAPVDADISKLGRGLYLVEFPAGEEGVYRVVVDANSSEPYIGIGGRGGASITVVKGLYGLGEDIGEARREILGGISGLGENISLRIAQLLSSINTESSEIKAGLGNLSARLSELGGELRGVEARARIISDEINEASSMIAEKLDKEIAGAEENITASIEGARKSLGEEVRDLKAMVAALYAVVAVLAAMVFKAWRRVQP